MPEQNSKAAGMVCCVICCREIKTDMPVGSGHREVTADLDKNRLHHKLKRKLVSRQNQPGQMMLENSGNKAE